MSLRILLIAVGGLYGSLLIVRKLIVTEIKSLVQVHKDGVWVELCPPQKISECDLIWNLNFCRCN